MEKSIKKNKVKSKRISFALGEKYPTITFSMQESEVMLLGLQGKSISKIGALMNLSPRTVEFYFCKMRLKLNCKSKAELLEKVSETDFLKNKLKTDHSGNLAEARIDTYQRLSASNKP